MRFLSQVYTIARGSVGGITYTANQWHQLIARAKTSPVQPGTPFQTGIRTAFDAADALWLQLSEANKQLWDDYAVTCVYTGPLGTYTVPGRQLYIGTIALVLYAAGQPLAPAILQANTPPVIAGWYNPGAIFVGSYTGLTQGIAVNLTNPTDESGIVVVDVSLAFNVTRNRYKGPWQSASKAIRDIPAHTSLQVLIDRNIATLGKAVFTRIRLFSAEISPNVAIPHRLSSVSHLRHIVEAGP